jgi:hypothetical protein
MRITPAGYKIRGWYLKSWVVEGSVDRENWMEIDRQTDNVDFEETEWNTASFRVFDQVAYRLIRLTQKDVNHNGRHDLSLAGVEFFGALSEEI